MFYFGLSYDGHARDGAAFSDDLCHWQKINEILIDVGPEGNFDSRYAHKPGIMTAGDTLYHFYCAVAPTRPRPLGEHTLNEIRGIAVATSE